MSKKNKLSGDRIFKMSMTENKVKVKMSGKGERIAQGFASAMIDDKNLEIVIKSALSLINIERASKEDGLKNFLADLEKLSEIRNKNKEKTKE